MLKRSLLRIKLLVSTIIALFYTAASARFTNISVQQAKTMIDSKDYGLILDVRTKEEFVGELGHIEGAVLIPINELKGRVGEIEKHKDENIIVMCRSGKRSRTAGNILARNGFGKVYNVAGGMVDWNFHRYPVKR